MQVSGVGEIKTVPREGTDGWVEVGRITRSVGLDGALQVQLHGDDPANLLEAEQLRLRGKPGTIPFGIARAEAAGVSADGRARLRLWLTGLGSRERAEVWAGAVVELPEAALAALPEGEFYWRDLIGLRVRTIDGRELGRLEEIWPTGSNDVLVVRSGTRLIMVPALRSVLAGVDLAAGEIRVDPPEGMLLEDE